MLCWAVWEHVTDTGEKGEEAKYIDCWMHSREFDLFSPHRGAGESSLSQEAPAQSLNPPCPAPAHPGSHLGAQQARLVLNSMGLLPLQGRKDHGSEQPADSKHSLVESFKILRYGVYGLLSYCWILLIISNKIPRNIKSGKPVKLKPGDAICENPEHGN